MRAVLSRFLHEVHKQSGASFCSTTGAADFHRASLNFYFPPNVSVAGRVWKSGCTEVDTLLRSGLGLSSLQWHEDVSVLPTTAFLRAELALQTELKAAFAVPLCKDSRGDFVEEFSQLFYDRFPSRSVGSMYLLLALCLACEPSNGANLYCHSQRGSHHHFCQKVS